MFTAEVFEEFLQTRNEVILDEMYKYHQEQGDHSLSREEIYTNLLKEGKESSHLKQIGQVTFPTKTFTFWGSMNYLYCDDYIFESCYNDEHSAKSILRTSIDLINHLLSNG